MKKYQIHYHPVWDEALSTGQKASYEKLVAGLSFVEDQLTAVGTLGNYKKNGGFSATVLLNNGWCEAMDVNHLEVTILDGNKDVIAKESFEPHLHINAHSSQPWSFVFSEEMVKRKTSI